MTKKNIAIVGVTGLVGRTVLDLLKQMNFPVGTIRLFASKQSSGQRIQFGQKDILVEELNTKSFRDIDIAFFCASNSVAKEFAPVAVQSGAIVIDNSSAFRMNKDVPLIVPEINMSDFMKNGKLQARLIANPNCTTIIFLMGIYPILQQVNIKKAIVSTYQSVSGAGYAAMEELELQTKDQLTKKDTPPRVFPYPIAFNLFAHESQHNDYGESQEEAKLYNESRKILNQAIHVSATCIRVPIFRAHTESIYLELEKSISIESIQNSLNQFSGVKLVDNWTEHHFPMPIEASHQHDVLVGRIRYDRCNPNGLWLMVCGDQILKGAALNAVQIAMHC